MLGLSVDLKALKVLRVRRDLLVLLVLTEHRAPLEPQGLRDLKEIPAPQVQREPRGLIQPSPVQQDPRGLKAP
jgi:hypothetical protein